jgi:hypothetical protein
LALLLTVDRSPNQSLFRLRSSPTSQVLFSVCRRPLAGILAMLATITAWTPVSRPDAGCPLLWDVIALLGLSPYRASSYSSSTCSTRVWRLHRRKALAEGGGAPARRQRMRLASNRRG